MALLYTERLNYLFLGTCVLSIMIYLIASLIVFIKHLPTGKLSMEIKADLKNGQPTLDQSHPFRLNIYQTENQSIQPHSNRISTVTTRVYNAYCHLVQETLIISDPIKSEQERFLK